MEHPLPVELRERRHVAAAVAERAVGSVLEDAEAVAGRELDQPPALGERHGGAGRVLEVRDGVEELRHLPA